MARSERLAAAAALALALPARAGLPPRYGGELGLALPTRPAELDPARAAGAGELLAARAVHATLVEVDASGALRPGLLAALPEAEPGGRAFRLGLRPGLRFHGGAPLAAADVAASLSRLASPALRSPHAWIVLPVKGFDEVRAGRAPALAGVQVLSETELRVELEVPFPAFPQALAAVPAAVARAAVPAEGAGPFRLAGEVPGGARLTAFDAYFRGRAYADGLLLLGLDARRAARAFARGEIDLAVRPEALPGAAAPEPLPAVTATWALVGARLGGEAAAVRGALVAVDRAELCRFVRGPAVPLWNPLPPPLWPAQAAPAPAAAGPARPGTRLSLLVAAGDASRAVADRLQVKLFDRGVRVAVQPLPPEALAARLAAGDFDLALLTRTLAAPAAAAAALEVAWALGGPAAARRALSRLAGADPGAVAAEAAEEAGAVPLLATGLSAWPRAGLHGLTPLPDGGFDPGELWTLPAGAR
jgi:ABC-type transport system substrate-binding protein